MFFTLKYAKNMSNQSQQSQCRECGYVRPSSNYQRTVTYNLTSTCEEKEKGVCHFATCSQALKCECGCRLDTVFPVIHYSGCRRQTSR
jgi:hypothetical protein